MVELSLLRLLSEYRDYVWGGGGFRQTDERFPLLVKLLDCAQWLSVQVHPNEELTLERYESLIVPASCGAYRVHPHGALRLLKVSVE